MEVQIMPALDIGGPHWPSSSLMMGPWGSAWGPEKGDKSPTWSQDAGTVWNADSPSEKQKTSERSSSSLRPISTHNRRKPLSVRPPPSLLLPPSPVFTEKVSPGFSNRSDLEDPDTPTGTESSKLAGSPRTCINCGTTKTPLWRNGPEGYKSLCNACGIRLKKLSKKGSPTSARSPKTSTAPPKPATKKRTSTLYRGSSGDVSGAAIPQSSKRVKAANGPIKKRWVSEEDSSEGTSSGFSLGGVRSGAYWGGDEDEAVGDGVLEVEHGAELLMMLAYGFRR